MKKKRVDKVPREKDRKFGTARRNRVLLYSRDFDEKRSERRA
jgi:hypothetical protein